MKLKKTLPNNNFKKFLSGFFVFLLLALIVWIIRIIDDVLLKEFRNSRFIMPVVASLILMGFGGIFYNRLKKTELLKYEFVTVAAHRIRTPLSRLGWMIAGIKDDIKTESGKAHLADIEETSAELTRIANHLLTAAESGKSSLYYSYFPHEEDIGIICRQVIGEYAIGARKKNIEILISIAPELPKSNIDRDRIREAIGIFLENAILYTPNNGRIEVYASKEWNHIKVTVKDSGIGIGKDELIFVFTKFYRTKSAVAADADRAGLGLAIAKDIIEHHGGSVGVDSLGKNKGSTFWFTIPSV